MESLTTSLIVALIYGVVFAGVPWALPHWKQLVELFMIGTVCILRHPARIYAVALFAMYEDDRGKYEYNDN